METYRVLSLELGTATRRLQCLIVLVPGEEG